MSGRKSGYAGDGQADELIGSTALRERGWSPAMIRDLLGDADQTRPNPYSRKAAPMRLWSTQRRTRGSPPNADGSRDRRGSSTPGEGRKALIKGTLAG